jgi:transposase
MPRKSPFDMNLSSQERLWLESMARRYSSPYRDVIRAKIILLADEGLSNDLIAARLDTPRQIVSKWRKRFALTRLPGLEAQPRGGREARFSPGLVIQVKALACELPRRLGPPLSRLSIEEIRQQVIFQGLVAKISGATLRRFGSAAIPSVGGNIAAGFSLAILTLLPKPAPCSICTSAFERALPWALMTSSSRRTKGPAFKPAAGNNRPGPGRAPSREGAWTYLAAWNVHRAKVFGRREINNGIAPVERPNSILIHNPIHASWFNPPPDRFRIRRHNSESDDIAELGVCPY